MPLGQREADSYSKSERGGDSERPAEKGSLATLPSILELCWALYKADGGSRQAPCWPTHQGRHGEADDLEVAVIVPLGLEVMVLPRVAPGHGACAVPGGREHEGCRGQSCRMKTAGPQSLPLLTWGCSGKQCTGVSGPESWGSGQFHHTGDRNGEGVGGTRVVPSQPPSQLGLSTLPAARPAHHHSDVLGQVLGAAHQEVGEGCLWEAEASPSGDRDHPSPPLAGALWPGRHGWAWEEGCCWAGRPRLTPA